MGEDFEFSFYILFYFKNRLQANDWIANVAENEGRLEVMREQLNYNFIYTSNYFILKNGAQMEVVLLTEKNKK